MQWLLRAALGLAVALAAGNSPAIEHAFAQDSFNG